MNQTSQEKLAALGLKAEKLDDYVAILRRASTRDEFIREYARGPGKDGFGAGYQQIIGPLFQKLWKQDPTIQEEVYRQLEPLDVPNEVIDEYFSREPSGLLFNLKHKDIPVETRIAFVEKTNELMLQLLKRHLGFD